MDYTFANAFLCLWEVKKSFENISSTPRDSFDLILLKMIHNIYTRKMINCTLISSTHILTNINDSTIYLKKNFRKIHKSGFAADVYLEFLQAYSKTTSIRNFFQLLIHLGAIE